MVRQIFEILRKPPMERSQSEVHQIFKATENIKFFQKITTEEQSNKVHIACCSLLLYEQFSKGQYVFRIGEFGDKFYIILQGEVSVKIPLQGHHERLSSQESDNENDQLNAIRQTRRNAVITSQTSFMTQQPQQDNRVKQFVQQQVILQAQKLFPQPQIEILVQEEVEVKRLKEGSSFGELALIRDAPRAASCYCRKDTVLAVLTKQDYQKILKNLHEKHINEKIKFLQNLPIFRGLTRSRITQLSDFFKSKRFKINQSVFKEGDKVDKIYIIRYGEFKFTKNYKLEYRVDNNKRTRLKQWRDKFTKLKQLQLYIKSSHDIFGFEDFKDNFNYRSMTCTCISFQAELLAIKINDFKVRVHNPETIKYLNQKMETHYNRFKRRSEMLKSVEDRKELMAFTPPNVLLGYETRSNRHNNKNWQYSNRLKSSQLEQYKRLQTKSVDFSQEASNKQPVFQSFDNTAYAISDKTENSQLFSTELQGFWRSQSQQRKRARRRFEKFSSNENPYIKTTHYRSPTRLLPSRNLMKRL